MQAAAGSSGLSCARIVYGMHKNAVIMALLHSLLDREYLFRQPCGGGRPGDRLRSQAGGDRRVVAAGESDRHGARCAARPAARCRHRGWPLSRPAGADRHAERADGAAAGGRRPGRVPAAVARRAARRARHPVHAGRDGRRADDPGRADHRRAGAPGRRGRLARVRRAAALARRRHAARRRSPCCGTLRFSLRHGRARGLRPGDRRSRRGDDRRRQHRRRHARDDDRDRARDEQGRPAARARRSASC